MVTYGSLVWAPRIPRDYAPLVRLQRLALLMLGSFLKSTPTSALEVVFNMMPLGLFVRMTAKLAAN